MKAAFLSSSLISSKGSAAPVSRSQHPSELIASRELVKKDLAPDVPSSKMLNKVAYNQPKPAAERKEASQQKTVSRKPVASSFKHFEKKSKKLKKDHLGRVRVSVRMSPDDHLALKLLSAHARKSSQVIMEEALHEYIAKHGSEILPEACTCLKSQLSGN